MSQRALFFFHLLVIFAKGVLGSASGNKKEKLEHVESDQTAPTVTKSLIGDDKEYTLKHLQHVRDVLANLAFKYADIDGQFFCVEAEADIILPVLFIAKFFVNEEKRFNVYQLIQEESDCEEFYDPEAEEKKSGDKTESIKMNVYKCVLRTNSREDINPDICKNIIAPTSTIVATEIGGAYFSSCLPPLHSPERRREALRGAAKHGLEILTLSYESWQHIDALLDSKKSSSEARSAFMQKLLTDAYMMPASSSFQGSLKLKMPFNLHICLFQDFCAGCFERCSDISIYKLKANDLNPGKPTLESLQYLVVMVDGVDEQVAFSLLADKAKVRESEKGGKMFKLDGLYGRVGDEYFMVPAFAVYTVCDEKFSAITLDLDEAEKIKTRTIFDGLPKVTWSDFPKVKDRQNIKLATMRKMKKGLAELVHDSQSASTDDYLLEVVAEEHNELPLVWKVCSPFDMQLPHRFKVDKDENVGQRWYILSSEHPLEVSKDSQDQLVWAYSLQSAPKFFNTIAKWEKIYLLLMLLTRLPPENIQVRSKTEYSLEWSVFRRDLYKTIKKGHAKYLQILEINEAKGNGKEKVTAPTDHKTAMIEEIFDLYRFVVNSKFCINLRKNAYDLIEGPSRIILKDVNVIQELDLEREYHFGRRPDRLGFVTLPNRMSTLKQYILFKAGDGGKREPTSKLHLLPPIISVNKDVFEEFVEYELITHHQSVLPTKKSRRVVPGVFLYQRSSFSNTNKGTV